MTEYPVALTDAFWTYLARTHPDAYRVLREHGVHTAVVWVCGPWRFVLGFPSVPAEASVEFDRALNALAQPGAIIVFDGQPEDLGLRADEADQPMIV